MAETWKIRPALVALEVGDEITSISSWKGPKPVSPELGAIYNRRQDSDGQVKQTITVMRTL